MLKLNKIIILSLGFLILLGLMGIFIVMLSGNNGNRPAAPVNPSSDTITLQTAQGTIIVNNYYKYPFADTKDALVLEQNARYQILNQKSDNSFQIILNAKPLKQNREEAENSFLNDLNISEQQACWLNVSVKTAPGLDPGFANKELKMSFCPNAITLP